MGIRYYAYAFDADETEQALADPRSFISSDPLADAWGMEPHARLAVATFQQSVPERDLLYLDKAWRGLQLLTGPTSPSGPARPAFRMFEGSVTFAPDGYSWTPWVRALDPAEVVLIAADLDGLVGEIARERYEDPAGWEGGAGYVLDFLHRARAFTAGLAREGRGMAYLIG